MNKQKMIMGISVALMVVGIGISVNISIKQKKSSTNNDIVYNQKEKQNKPNAIPQKNNIVMEKNNKGKTVEVFDLKKSSGEFDVGNVKADFISDSKAKMIEQQARNLIAKGDWVGASKVITPVISKFDLNTTYGQIIQNIYYDTALVQNLKTANKKMYKQICSNFKDVEDLVTIVLQLKEKDRRDIILCEDSLAPVFNKGFQIKSIYKDTSNELQDVFNIYPDASDIYVANVLIENKELKCYILGFPDNSIMFHSIVAPKGINNEYQTIKYWKHLDKEIKQNLNNK